MKVSMLTETSWYEKHLKIGDEIDVPAEVGQCWVNRRIAVLVETKPKESTVPELKEIAKGLGISGYNQMNKNELLVAIAEAEETKKAAAELKELQIKAQSLGFSSVETMTKEELEEAISLGSKVVELNIEGAETMTKEQVLKAIEEATKKGADKE